MKIRVYETVIEADARELRESNTLASNFAAFLSRCFRNTEPFDDDGSDDVADKEEPDGA